MEHKAGDFCTKKWLQTAHRVNKPSHTISEILDATIITYKSTLKKKDVSGGWGIYSQYTKKLEIRQKGSEI